MVQLFLKGVRIRFSKKPIATFDFPEGGHDRLSPFWVHQWAIQQAKG